MAEKAKHPKRRRILVIACGVLLLALFAGGLFFFLNRQSSSPFSQTITSSVSFPLYYSKGLPEGFQLDKESVSFKQGVVVYSLSTKDGKKIFVSQQKRPEGFDFEGFYEDKLSEAYEIQTSNGTATIGIVNDKTRVFSIVTGDTWVFASGAKEINNTKFEAFARGLALTKL